MLGKHLEMWTKAKAEDYHPPCYGTEESEEVSVTVAVVRKALY